MTTAILNAFSCVVALIACAVIYVFVVAKQLPFFLLTPSYKKHTPVDRGIHKYKFPEGRGVVCQPDEKYKDYLKKYIIFVYKNRKYIKCKLSDEVVSIRYQVAVYNNTNKLIKILDLAENINVKGETDTVRLPDEAAYASVVLKTVNEKESFPSLRKVSFVKLSVFAVLTIALTIACGLLARTTVLSIFTLLNLEWHIGLGINLAISSIVGALTVLLFLIIRKKEIFGEKL